MCYLQFHETKLCVLLLVGKVRPSKAAKVFAKFTRVLHAGSRYELHNIMTISSYSLVVYSVDASCVPIVVILCYRLCYFMFKQFSYW